MMRANSKTSVRKLGSGPVGCPWRRPTLHIQERLMVIVKPTRTPKITQPPTPSVPTSSHTAGNLWSVQSILKTLKQSTTWDESTVERVYEADVFPAVFDFSQWREHRDRRRYYVHLSTMFGSYFLRDLMFPLLTLMGIAALVGAYETGVELGGWSHLPNIAQNADVPLPLTSFALSLMLVFRTNSSYGRWLEARKEWGSIVTYSRNFVRQSLTAIPVEEEEMRSALARWTVATVQIIKLHVREEGDMVTTLQDVLHPNELAVLLASTHRPVTCLAVMGEILAVAETHGYLCSQTRARLEDDLKHIGFSLGACERIVRNPIPLSYTRHTARFLIIWLIWLPYALWDKIHWAVIPVEGIIAYLLLGIDEIAIQLEEPFGILPLESLVMTVQRSVNLMLDSSNDVKSLAASYSPLPLTSPTASNYSPPKRRRPLSVGRVVSNDNSSSDPRIVYSSSNGGGSSIISSRSKGSSDSNGSSSGGSRGMITSAGVASSAFSRRMDSLALEGFKMDTKAGRTGRNDAAQPTSKLPPEEAEGSKVSNYTPPYEGLGGSKGPDFGGSTTVVQPALGSTDSVPVPGMSAAPVQPPGVQGS